MAAPTNVGREIIKLKQKNITGLILDICYNGGGSAEEAAELAGIFIINSTGNTFNQVRADLNSGRADINKNWTDTDAKLLTPIHRIIMFK